MSCSPEYAIRLAAVQLETDHHHALLYNELFNKGQITAEQLCAIPKDHLPISDEANAMDIENVKKICDLIWNCSSNEEFRQLLDEIEGLLPQPFELMRDYAQNGSHGGNSPREHTLIACKLLDTSGLSSRNAFIARMTIIFHDIGKVYNPIDYNHPYLSRVLAEKYLKEAIEDKELLEAILHQIEYHVVLGETLNDKVDDNKRTPDYVAGIFPTSQALATHRAVSFADVKSIPTLARQIDQLEEMYQKVYSIVASNRD